MLGWALTFFLVAIIAGVLGFGGIAIVSVEIARVLFFLFLIGFVVTLVLHLFGRRSAPPL